MHCNRATFHNETIQSIEMAHSPLVKTQHTKSVPPTLGQGGGRPFSPHKTALKMHHPLPLLPPHPLSCSGEIDIRVTVPLNYHIVPNFSSIVSHYGGPGEVRSVPYRFKIDANSLEAASLGPTPLPNPLGRGRGHHTRVRQASNIVSFQLV